jgi:hypothetical protein
MKQSDLVDFFGGVVGGSWGEECFLFGNFLYSFCGKKSYLSLVYLLDSV